MVYWNSDGSRAAMCGNAALCSTRLAVYLELARAGRAPPAHRCRRRSRPAAPDAGDQAEIRLPDFDLARRTAPGSAARAGPGERWMAFATVGVPHLVIRVDDIEAVDVAGPGPAAPVRPAAGPGGRQRQLRRPPAAPGEPWLIRTYERGVEGETLACGTGTVAAGVALAARGEATLPVRFRTRGGAELLVRATLEGRGRTNVWLGWPGQAGVPGRLGRLSAPVGSDQSNRRLLPNHISAC